MSRESVIAGVNQLAKDIKRPITISRYIRKRVVQEEMIDAYISPVPTAVIVNGRARQVEIGDWIIIQADGAKSTFKDNEFKTIFESCAETKSFGEGADVRRK